MFVNWAVGGCRSCQSCDLNVSWQAAVTGKQFCCGSMFHYENPNVSLAKGNLPYYMPNALCSTFPILFPILGPNHGLYSHVFPPFMGLLETIGKLDDAERMESIVSIVLLVGKIPNKCSEIEHMNSTILHTSRSISPVISMFSFV